MPGPGAATDPKLIQLLKRELLMQCAVAEAAWNQLVDKIRNPPSYVPESEPDGGVRNQDKNVRWLAAVWASTQGILSATGQISRMLWPEGTRAEKDAEYAPDLRANLKLPILPSLQDRKVRNAFEHVESKAPDWFAWAVGAFPGRPLVGFAIGDGLPMGPKLVEVKECFRFLNTSNWSLKVGHETPLDIRALLADVSKLASTIDVSQRFFVDLVQR
jgi:hypothetical protein